MNKYRLWLGLIAFSAGIVFFLNLGGLFPYNANSSLMEKILVEIVIAVLIFGGLLLMSLSLRSTSSSPKPKKS